MAQFDFWATWDDDWVLVDAILVSMGAAIVPDIWYPTPQVDTYRSLDGALKDSLRVRRGAFVFPPFVTPSESAGLVLQTDGEKAGWYSVYPTYAGECLELTLPACFDCDGVIAIANGMLSYQATHWDHESNDWSPPSHDLVRFYRDLRSLLRKHMARVDTGGTRVWMGGRAESLYHSGDAELLVDGKWTRKGK